MNKIDTLDKLAEWLDHLSSHYDDNGEQLLAGLAFAARESVYAMQQFGGGESYMDFIRATDQQEE